MPAVKEKNFEIMVTYILYASPDEVFDALTQESRISDWMDANVKLEPFKDGTIELFDGWMKGTILQFNKIKRELAYTWKPAEWSKKQPASKVVFSLKKHEAGTEIVVHHSDFPNKEESEKHRSGWVDHFFEPLNDYFTR
jgi:uncharacterized protein YndB with AHSA1/START domain